MTSVDTPYKFCSMCGSKLELRENGNLACTKCPFVNYRNPRPTVTALVMYKNKLLLTKRARAPFKDWWDLPGGFMEKDETPEEAVRRELIEETGLKIKLEKLFGIYPGTYPSDTEPFHILSIVYLATSSSASLEAFDDVCESKWFAKNELPKQVAFDSNQRIMKEFIKQWK